jgi:uncharacterized membrane protein
MDFKAAIEAAGQWVDLAGVATVVIGALISIPLALRRRGDGSATLYRSYRQLLGRSILLGLELLVAGTSSGPLRSRPRCRASPCWRSSW